MTAMQSVAPEPLEDAAYLFDGSLEGLLSAIFQCYARREVPADIVPAECYRPRLGQSAIPIETDADQASRVRAGIQRAAGREGFRWVLEASLCDDYDMGAKVHRFVRYLMDREHAGANGRRLLDDLAHPAVAPIASLRTQALNEAEKMRQFVRFSHLQNGIWFARCNPTVSVIPLVIGHFAQRFNDQPFIIYDEVHRLSGIYDGESWYLAAGEVEAPAAPTARDRRIEEAWCRFYDVLSIDARYNPELRRNFMPKRLWRNIPEVQPRTPGLKRV